MRRIVLNLVALMLSAAASASTAAGQSPPSGPPCETPEHRQFDFWLGEWEVVDTAGTVLGRNSITRAQNGCVLHEHWTGARGMTGESFNIYLPAAGQWHQSWVDSGGNLLLLNGRFESGAMVLHGETAAATGGVRRHRITYSRLEKGMVRQLWETSADGGVTWVVAFDGRYRRTGEQSP